MITLGPAPQNPEDFRQYLAEIREAILALQNPGEPTAVWSVAQADLPDAADYPNCVVQVSDIPTLAISRLSGSTWAWVRADGSAL